MIDLGKTLYINHLGDKFEFGKDTGAFIDGSELFSYERSYEAAVNAYQTLSVKPKAANVIVMFDGTVKDSRRKFFEVVDVDAEAGVAGTIQYGEYKMRGMFVGSSNSSFAYGSGEMIRKMTFLTEKPIWQRDIVKLFTEDLTRAALINKSYRSSPVTIEAFGPVSSVLVSIGDNTYEIDESVPTGSKLVIDGLSKTAKIIAGDGTEINVLDSRVGPQVKGSGYYIFEEVPSGYNTVVWNPKCLLRITVHEQRLEVRRR